MPFTQEEKLKWKEKVALRKTMNYGKKTDDLLCGYYQGRQSDSTVAGITVGIILLICTILFFFLLFVPMARADQVLKASWYSEESLKREGTWRISHGIQANGKAFNEKAFTCASRIHTLGKKIKVTNLNNGKSVVVTCTDRIGKRFAATRIDLSRAAFEKIAALKEGLIDITVEVIK